MNTVILRSNINTKIVLALFLLCGAGISRVFSTVYTVAGVLTS